MPHTPPDRRPSVGAFPPAGVRAVAFDAVGTLVEPWPPVGEAYAAAGCRHGITLDAETARSRFRAAWRRQELADAAATPAFRGPARSSQLPKIAALEPRNTKNSVYIQPSSGLSQSHVVAVSFARKRVESGHTTGAVMPTALVSGSQNTENP